MNLPLQLSIKTVGAIVLVSFGVGFIPTASACDGDACTLYSISGNRISNKDAVNKISLHGCQQLSNSSTSGSSACIGSVFDTTIGPSGSWTATFTMPNNIKLVVLTAKLVPLPGTPASTIKR